MPFCQTIPLLPSVPQQQNVMKYWQEGSASTTMFQTSASDVMGQHNKIGSITFGAALIKTRWVLKKENSVKTSVDTLLSGKLG